MTSQERFSKTLHWLLTAVIGIYLTALAFTYFAQNNLIYVGTTLNQSSAYDEKSFSPWLNDWMEPIGYKSTVKDSTEIWLCFHGNGERAEKTLRYYSGIRSIIQDAKIDIYVLEYPGYGSRPGKLSERSLIKAGLEAIDLLAEKPKRLYVLGHSLGSGVGSQAVARKKHKVHGYVMLTPFTSMQAAARNRINRTIGPLGYLMPAEWLMRDHYRSIDYISGIQCPISILACKDDTTTPYWMSEKLKEVHPQTMLKPFSGDHYVPLEPLPDIIEAFNFVRVK